MTTDPFAPSDEALQRDRFGRPKIRRPDGSEAWYTRTSTLAKILEDTQTLTKWQIRKALKGMSLNDGIAARIATLDPDRDRREFDDLAERAIEAAKGTEARDVGTGLHAMTEQLDNGKPVSDFPRQWQPALRSYQDTMRAAGLERIAGEVFVVNDEYEIAGTLDHLVRETATGKVYVGDLKTGDKQLEYGFGSVQLQVAIYARSAIYDTTTHQRYPLHNVDLERGVLIHLPQSTGVCELIELDLVTGWAEVMVALKVRESRRKKPVRQWRAPLAVQS